ncbi:MAG: hypothetical protein AB7S39_15780 [Gemmatimonadales bacterium]
MNSRHFFLPVFLAVGCGGTPTTDGSTIDVQTVAVGAPLEADNTLSLDEAFRAIGDRVPGFAGMYMDDSTGIVLVTSAAAAFSALEIAAAEIEAAPLSSDLEPFRGAPLEWREVRNTWEDLYRWRRAFEDRMPPATVYTDIDERNNRVQFAMLPGHAGEAVALANAIGIPQTAVSVRETNPPRIESRGSLQPPNNLFSVVRPTIGGLSIEVWYSLYLNWPDTTLTSRSLGCTLGANVVVLGSSDPVFLTNSHCTQALFEPDTMTLRSGWYQPGRFLSPSDTTASIAVLDRTDPPLFSGGSCPAGRLCRWSDAALVTYSSADIWQGGTVAAPDVSAAAPFPFVVSVPYVQSLQLVGNGIYKTGIATGLKFGQNVATCQNFNLDVVSYPLDPPPPNATLLCQYQTTQMANASGDSGGPMFRWAGFVGANAKFMGVHWGGFPDQMTTTYSPASGIVKDLGTLYYHLQ